MKKYNVAYISLFMFLAVNLCSGELYGLSQTFKLNLGLDNRIFPSESPYSSNNYPYNFNIFIKPEYQLFWNDEAHSFVMKPDLRYDQHDKTRTEWDLDDFYWSYFTEPISIKVGRSIEYWGVTESQQLVNIINQINLAENLYGDSRLGQGMLKLTVLHGRGEWSFYILPEFRPRLFPDVEGRPSSAIPIVSDSNKITYEAKEKDRHIDFATRLTSFIADHEFAFSIFKGTSREPELIPVVGPNMNPAFVPYYTQLTQFGLEWQSTLDSLLLKMELVQRYKSDEQYLAGTLGEEYTFFDVIETGLDVGVFLEYLFDRHDHNREYINAQNDIFYGLRIAGNDESDSTAIGGVSFDLDDSTSFCRLQFSTRLFGSTRLSADATLILKVAKENVIYQNRKDGFLNLKLETFF